MIYLDNAATTKPSHAAKVALERSFSVFGNPSSLHQMGMDADREITAAREEIARIIGAKPTEIYFTGSGTEANNLAIFGAVKKHKDFRISTTKFEHPSIVEPLNKLKSQGFDVVHDADFSDLRVLSHVNSENGEIRDLRKSDKHALTHVDACQSFCKLPINVKSLGIDLLSMSAHKIGGLKGVGALYVRDGVNLAPIIYGGGHEGGLRSGTENVAGIMAMAAAAKDFWANLAAHHAHVITLKTSFLKVLKNAEIHGGENVSPYILSFSIAGVKSHILLNALSAEGVYVSVGHACSTKKQHKKGVNDAMRVSFSPENTLEEIEIAKEKFEKCVKMLMRK
ncbi:MAG: cysteine desulfurase [Defluviitaleaceae bacterium]|nr:cysteine desulfurase [Defluviitaleaceae bacterium]